MADTMKFVLELQDKVSGGAKNASSSLQNLDKSFGDTGAAGDGAGESMGGAAVEFNAIAEIGAKVADVLKEVVSTALEIGKFAVDAKEFKDQTMVALNALEGSSGAADDAYAKIQQVANASGSKTEDIAKKYEDLRRLGMSSAEAMNTIAAGLDVAKLGGSADAFDAAMAKITSTGKIEPRELKELGIPVEALEQNLAKAHGIVIDKGGAWRKQVEAMMQSGKISAAEAQTAILESVNKIGGDKGLGALSKDLAGESFTAQMQTLQNGLQDLFANINIQPLVDALKSISSLFDQNTATGKELRDILSSAFGAIGDIIGKVFTKGNIEGFLGAVMDLAHAFGKVWNFVEPLVEAFLGGAWEGIKAAVGPLIDMLKKLFGGGGGDNSSMIKTFKLLGQIVGFVVGLVVDQIALMISFSVMLDEAIGAAIGAAIDFFSGFGQTVSDIASAVGDAIGSIVDWFESLPDKLSDMVSAAVDIGANFIDGLVQGLEDNAAKVLDFLKGLANSAIDSVEETLGIKSPSKVMMEIGAHTAAGFAAGVNDNADVATDAMGSMATPPPATGGIGGGGKSGGNEININITLGGTATQADADKIRAAVFDAIEQASSQLGVALVA